MIKSLPLLSVFWERQLREEHVHGGGVSLGGIVIQVSTHVLWETPVLLLQVGFLQTEIIVD